MPDRLGKAAIPAETAGYPPARNPRCPAARPAPPLPAAVCGWDDAVAGLYAAHYRSLVRLAVLLVGDVAVAEDLVQDCFATLHDAWQRPRSPDWVLLYLRRAVINRSRSVPRHRAVAARGLPQVCVPDAPSARETALEHRDRALVPAALRILPARQREAMILRYYADLTDRQVAAVMRISVRAAKTHLSRGLAALRGLWPAGVLGEMTGTLHSASLTAAAAREPDRRLLTASSATLTRQAASSSQSRSAATQPGGRPGTRLPARQRNTAYRSLREAASQTGSGADRPFPQRKAK